MLDYVVYDTTGFKEVQKIMKYESDDIFGSLTNLYVTNNSTIQTKALTT